MDSQIIHETFHLTLGKNPKAKAKLFIYEFNDNGYIVLYNKSLQLSAYGKTVDDAQNMFFKIIFKDFFENLTNLPAIDVMKEFKRLGWKANPFFKKELSNTAHIDKEGVLRDFNLPQDAEIKEHYIAV